MSEPTAAVAAEPSLLDDLYWNTDLSATEIGRRVGRSPNSLHRHVTPLGAGVECRWCAAPLTYTSRTSRTDARLRCGACGASRRNPAHPDAAPPCRPTVVGGVIAVRQRATTRWDRWDPGRDIDDCIDALAVAGVAWDPQALVVLPGGAGDGADVVELLADRPAGIVAVRSLCELADTQTERLQALFALTRLRWRVLVAHDIDGRTAREIRSRHLDRLDDPYDERDRWSESWSEHLVGETYESSRTDDRGWM